MFDGFKTTHIDPLWSHEYWLIWRFGSMSSRLVPLIDFGRPTLTIVSVKRWMRWKALQSPELSFNRTIITVRRYGKAVTDLACHTSGQSPVGIPITLEVYSVLPLWQIWRDLQQDKVSLNEFFSRSFYMAGVRSVHILSGKICKLICPVVQLYFARSLFYSLISCRYLL